MSDRKGTGQALLAASLIVGAALAVYHATFSAPFVFDDALIVANNPTIRHLGGALVPPHNGSTVDGRPLVNLSLAINYALSGTKVWSYHAVNLAIHVLAGLTLLGVVRRTVRGDRGRATALAFAIALLWTVHPLQTEAVTYIAQRAESLVSLLYLLTLYCFVRGIAGGPAWLALSFLACLAGAATKEIIVSAPLIVFLYDRTFVSGSLREAWRRRRLYYLALAATWIPLGCLVIGTANRSGTAGFGTNLRWSDYVLTQIYAVPHYLRLALWPSPLVFDYGRSTVAPGGALLLSAGVLLFFLAGTGVCLAARNTARRVAGFLGTAFFAILAPTSLIPVATQTMAEHRMYLPLAAVLAAAVLGVARRRVRPRAIAGWACVVAAGLGAATLARNEAYRSDLALWSDTVAKRPDNERAHNNLGNAYFALGRVPEAVQQYQETLRLHPDNADAQYNLGNSFLQEGKLPEAIAHSAEAVRLTPANPEAHNNLGMALDRSRRSNEAEIQFAEAIAQYQVVLRSDPEDARMRNGLAIAFYNAGNLQAKAGRMAPAIALYERALQLKPDFPEAQLNWGNALLADGKAEAALAHYRAALELHPGYPEAQYILATVLRQMPHPAAANGSR
jgi:Flp pilus assembly protein TadD